MTTSFKAVMGFHINMKNLGLRDVMSYDYMYTVKKVPKNLDWLDSDVNDLIKTIQHALDPYSGANVTISYVLKYFMHSQFFVVFDIEFPSKEKFNLFKLKNPELVCEFRDDWVRYNDTVLAGISDSDIEFKHDHCYPIGFI